VQAYSYTHFTVYELNIFNSVDIIHHLQLHHFLHFFYYSELFIGKKSGDEGVRRKERKGEKTMTLEQDGESVKFMYK